MIQWDHSLIMFAHTVKLGSQYDASTSVMSVGGGAGIDFISIPALHRQH